MNDKQKLYAGIIAKTFDEFHYLAVEMKTHDARFYDPKLLKNFLNKLNRYIPVWRDMSDDTKALAIKHIYDIRNNFEKTDENGDYTDDAFHLHSECCSAWEQATAYFMVMKYFVDAGVPASKFDEEATVNFFDDHDFTLETDVLTSEMVKKFCGVGEDFTKSRIESELENVT
jgi:hypothetical protein